MRRVVVIGADRRYFVGALGILPGERRRSHESQQHAERRQMASKAFHKGPRVDGRMTVFECAERNAIVPPAQPLFVVKNVSV
jgi:hypothetical protein